jgi:hypothetical protein
MKRPWLFVLAASFQVTVSAWPISAQDRVRSETQQPAVPVVAAAPAKTDDVQAIRSATQSFAKAFETGDNKAVAALFTADAEYLDEGSKPVRGRKALACVSRCVCSQARRIPVGSRRCTLVLLPLETFLCPLRHVG